MSSVSPTSKTCTKCGIEKPLAEFTKQKHGLYGHTARCKPCNNSQGRERYRKVMQENPDARRATQRKYYRKNKQEIRERKRREQSQPRALMLARYKERRMRAKRHGVAVIDLTDDQWEAQMSYFDYRCAYCLDPLETDEQDHIVPTSKGGGHTLDNVVPVCRSCNLSKLNRSLIQWLHNRSRKYGDPN